MQNATESMSRRGFLSAGSIALAMRVLSAAAPAESQYNRWRESSFQNDAHI